MENTSRELKKDWKILAGIALLMLVLAALLANPLDVHAAGKVKLSKTSLTFSSPDAAPQTVKIKNVKASNIKEVAITNYPEQWVNVSVKKNKIIVEPKLSSDTTAGGIDLIVEFKKPIKGDYRAYLRIESVQIKGNSDIPVKTADDLCNMQKNCTSNRWTYYLENDIDMTGIDAVDYRYADINLDGKGHKILSDGPVFDEFCGTIRDVVFVCNYECTASDSSDPVSRMLEDSYSMIAPVETLSVGSKMTGCRSTGTIHINYDKEMGEFVDILIAGLVGTNDYTAEISRCKSDVDITFDGDKCNTIHCLYAGGLVNTNKNKAVIRECQFDGSIRIGYDWPSAAGICHLNDNAGMIYDCLNSGSIKKIHPGYNDSCSGILYIGSESTVERVLNTGDADTGLYGEIISEDTYEWNIPKFQHAYYLKSKSPAFWYSNPMKPFAVPGVTGLEDSQLSDPSAFAGFDFDNVWKMGANGPELRNLPE